MARAWRLWVALAMLGGCVHGGRASVGGRPPEPTTAFVIGGDSHQDAPFHVDDQMIVWRNGVFAWSTEATAGQRGPVTIRAARGDILVVDFVDVVGVCRGHGEIWLRDVASGDSTRIAPAREDGCRGYPPGTLFDRLIVQL